jgi:D-alanyl-D-alanine carboxypeptidase
LSEQQGCLLRDLVDLAFGTTNYCNVHYTDVHCHWIRASGSEGSEGLSDAVFPYWSFTKTVIAICALKLVETRVLDLDTPAGDKRYTLRHLLAHTSGLRDYGHFRQYHAAVANGETPWSRDRLLDLVLADGPLFEPGRGWSYSNVGYLLVREMIERVTDQPLGAVISDRVTSPLDLSSIELSETGAQFGRIHWPAARRYDPRWVYHGCLTGTAADAAHLLHSLFAGRLLQSETLAEMRESRSIGGPIAGRPWTRCGYGLGLMSGHMGKAGTAIGHSGGGPFSVNAVYHFPEASDPMTVACFSEGVDEGEAEFKAAELVRSE